MADVLHSEVGTCPRRIAPSRYVKHGSQENWSKGHRGISMHSLKGVGRGAIKGGALAEVGTAPGFCSRDTFLNASAKSKVMVAMSLENAKSSQMKPCTV